MAWALLALFGTWLVIFESGHHDFFTESGGKACAAHPTGWSLKYLLVVALVWFLLFVSNMFILVQEFKILEILKSIKKNSWNNIDLNCSCMGLLQNE